MAGHTPMAPTTLGGGDKEAAVEFSKTPFSQLSAPRKIRSIRFSLMSPAEIGKCGVFHVFERNLYQAGPSRYHIFTATSSTRMLSPRVLSCAASYDVMTSDICRPLPITVHRNTYFFTMTAPDTHSVSCSLLPSTVCRYTMWCVLFCIALLLTRTETLCVVVHATINHALVHYVLCSML